MGSPHMLKRESGGAFKWLLNSRDQQGSVVTTGPGEMVNRDSWARKVPLPIQKYSVEPSPNTIVLLTIVPSEIATMEPSILKASSRNASLKISHRQRERPFPTTLFQRIQNAVKIPTHKPWRLTGTREINKVVPEDPAFNKGTASMDNCGYDRTREARGN